MIPRLVEALVIDKLRRLNLVTVILGARQTGKTTLVRSIIRKFKIDGQKVIYVNCDLEEDRNNLNTTSITRLTRLVSNADTVCIDEAQRLDNPGLTLKILRDNFTKLQILVTGSSAFALKNKVSDTMTGRYIDFPLFPLSLSEISKDKDNGGYMVDEILRFGQYPGVYTTLKNEDKIIQLGKIIESYLFQDILSFEKVRNSQAIKSLSKALAYQIGNEINENELASRLKIDRKTVVSYMDILEQAFVIKRLTPYSLNPRREIGKNYKVYFFDLGIRNALIGDFNPIQIRPDRGHLWENFLIMERMKKKSFKYDFGEMFFWRSYQGAEVDYLERSNSSTDLKAFEFKWDESSKSRSIKSFYSRYHLPVKIINRANYLDFIY